MFCLISLDGKKAMKQFYMALRLIVLCAKTGDPESAHSVH